VYVGNYDDWPEGNLYALDTSDGSEIWKVEFDNEIDSAPAVANGTVYVGDGTGQHVYALDAYDGTEKWSFETQRSALSPTVVDDTVYVTCRSNLYALDASDGTEKWSTHIDGDVTGAAAVVDGTLYAVGNEGSSRFGYNGYLHAIDASDGSEKWKTSFFTNDRVVSPPTVADGTVYMGSEDHNLYAVDASDGSKEWEYSTDGEISTSPTVSDGTVYVGGNDDSSFGSTTLYAIDASSGSKEWDFDAADIDASPTVADGTVYVYTTDANMIAVDASNGSEEWSASTDRSTIATSDPVVVSGTVYVGDSDGDVHAFGTGSMASSDGSRVEQQVLNQHDR